MAVSRIPSAATPAFDLGALKLHARVDGNDDDAGLTLMGRTAAAEIEQYADLALLRQTIVLDIEANGDPVHLPIGPLATDALVTINDSLFTGQISGGRYPVLTLPEAITGTVAVSYEAGWDTLAAIPADLQYAVIDHAAMLYDGRAADEIKQGLSVAAARIAARYRRVRT